MQGIDKTYIKKATPAASSRVLKQNRGIPEKRGVRGLRSFIQSLNEER